MTAQPSGPDPADRAAGDPASLVPPTTPATGHVTTGHVTTGHVTTGHVTTGHVTTGHVTTGHVTAGEISEFMRHLAELRHGALGVGDDPVGRAAFLVCKAALFARIADPHVRPVAGPASTDPEGRTL